MNPWSKSFHPLQSFRGEKSRAQVSAGFRASHSEVAAPNGEDSGSAWLAARAPRHAASVLAGQPLNAQ